MSIGKPAIGKYGIGPIPAARISLPVNPPSPPDILFARAILTERRTPWACVERTKNAYAWCGTLMSSAKRPVPVTNRISSRRYKGCEVPIIYDPFFCLQLASANEATATPEQYPPRRIAGVLSKARCGRRKIDPRQSVHYREGYPAPQCACLIAQ